MFVDIVQNSMAQEPATTGSSLYHKAEGFSADVPHTVKNSKRLGSLNPVPQIKWYQLHKRKTLRQEMYENDICHRPTLSIGDVNFTHFLEGTFSSYKITKVWLPLALNLAGNNGRITDNLSCVDIVYKADLP